MSTPPVTARRHPNTLGYVLDLCCLDAKAAAELCNIDVEVMEDCLDGDKLLSYAGWYALTTHFMKMLAAAKSKCDELSSENLNIILSSSNATLTVGPKDIKSLDGITESQNAVGALAVMMQLTKLIDEAHEANKKAPN